MVDLSHKPKSPCVKSCLNRSVDCRNTCEAFILYEEQRMDYQKQQEKINRHLEERRREMEDTQFRPGQGQKRKTQLF